MAHSWVQMYDDEYEAFKKYAEIYPTNCVLLVDTFNVLKSGVPAAIKVFKEMKPEKMGIRIDSGDIAYLTKNARKMLDDAGLQDCTIVVSNSLDEYLIRDIILRRCMHRFVRRGRETDNMQNRSLFSEACTSFRHLRRTGR